MTGFALSVLTGFLWKSAAWDNHANNVRGRVDNRSIT